MSKKKPPTWLESQLAPKGVAIDYGKYAGAGFQAAQPITGSKAQELRDDAAEILAAEYLQTKESNRRVRNQRAKDIKAAKQRFANTLIIDHGLETYTWPDGLTVRIEGPRLQSGRNEGSDTPTQVIFNSNYTVQS
jgi:hypothetical protein